MKKLLALTLCILFLTGCGAAVYEGPTESAWVRTDSLTTLYNTVTGESQTMRRTDSYDSFGNQVRTCYYSDGELTGDHKRTYDDRGNCIREVTWEHFWIFSYPVSRTSYTYDDQDRLLTTTYRNGLGIKTGGDTYTYDDEANTVTWDGTYDTQTKYLNEDGDILRVVTFSEPAGMEMEAIYEYDELRRNTKVTDYYDGVLSTTTENRYDEQDRLLESTIYDANGTLVLRTGYVYEENTITSRDHLDNVAIEVLRPDGQVETRECYGPDGKLLSRTENFYTQIQIPAKEE